MSESPDIIEFNKLFSLLLNAAKKEIKSGKCYMCEQDITSTAKSHTVPQFILKEIAENGKLCSNSFLNKHFLKSIVGNDIGVQKASTFRLLCDDCEHKLFKYYEDKSLIDDLMNDLDRKRFTHEDEIKLASIYLKSVLKEIHTKLLMDQHVLTPILDSRIEEGSLTGHNMHQINELNIMDYKIGIDRCAEVLEGRKFNNFYVYYHKTLGYQVKLSTQAVICVKNDFQNKIVNDITDLSKDVRMDDICVCIFPYDKRTHIIIFGLSEGKSRYKEMLRQFRNMTEQDKLKALQTLIFSYTEEIYISPSLYDIIKKDEQLLDIAFQGIIPSTYVDGDTIQMSLANNDISGYSNIKQRYLANKYAKRGG